jgi:hypothetical protein
LVASEELYAKYKDDIQFLIVYTIEAYPVGSPCPYSGRETIVDSSTTPDPLGLPIKQPETYEERVNQAINCKWGLGITIPMVIDDVDNAVWCTYGPASNIAYLIGTDGIVIEKQPYYIPEEMEAVVLEYVQANSM